VEQGDRMGDLSAKAAVLEEEQAEPEEQQAKNEQCDGQTLQEQNSSLL